MRLVSPSNNTAADSSQLLNTEFSHPVLHSSSRKRGSAAASSSSVSSFSSSLDFKADANQKLTTPGGRRKGKNRSQQEEAEQHVRQPPYATRARGSSGIPPPRKFDLSDLEHLSDEELMQVLYRDPDLAQAAAAQAQSSKQQRTYSTSRRGRSSRKRPKSRNPTEYPAHIQDRMEEGIPIFQWFIVLALLGIGIYQLWKLLMLPPPSSKHNKTYKTPSSSKIRGGKQPKATKTAKNKHKGNAAVKASSIKNSKGTPNNYVDKSKNNSSSTELRIEAETKEKLITFQPKKASSQHRNKKRNVLPRTDDGMLLHNGNHSPARTPLEASKALSEAGETIKKEEVATMDDDNDDTGWQPVGKRALKSGRPNQKAESDIKFYTKGGWSEERSNRKSFASPLTTGFTARRQLQGKVEDTGGGFQLAEKKKKKKEKTLLKPSDNRNRSAEPTVWKENETSQDSQADAMGSDSDAALALQLHQEETNASQANTYAIEHEEEWAEVPKKSKRKGSASRSSG